jgi:hypothetical protein
LPKTLFHRDPTVNGNMGDDKIKVISPDGKHLRAIKPFPADLPIEKVKAFGAVTTDDGQLAPIVRSYEQLSTYPNPIKDRGRSRPSNSTPTVDGRGRVYWPVLGLAIACLEADGNQDSGGPNAKVKKPDIPLAWPLTVAVSDTHVYVADTATGEWPK